MEGIQEIEGIKFGGVNINNLRYADDTVLIADSEESLQLMIDTLWENETENKYKGADRDGSCERRTNIKRKRTSG